MLYAWPGVKLFFITPHGMMSWLLVMVVYDCTVAWADAVIATVSMPNADVKNDPESRVTDTVIESWFVWFVVLVYVGESPALAFLARFADAALTALDHPVGSMDAPASAEASASACTACFSWYQ